MITTAKTTIRIDHGRRNGCRSPARRHKRQEDQEQTEDERAEQNHPPFRPLRDQGQQREIPEQVPVGAR